MTVMSIYLSLMASYGHGVEARHDERTPLVDVASEIAGEKETRLQLGDPVLLCS